jgi:hypothetical protein
MPHQDGRAKALANNGRNKTAGKMVVTYRDANGKMRDATVVSAGTSSGLKLALGAHQGLIVDNVPKATTVKSTGAYFYRTQ